MDAIQRGQRAKDLLADPLLSEALRVIQEALYESWVSSCDSADREEAWYTLKGLHRFELYLTTAMETGTYETTLKEQE